MHVGYFDPELGDVVLCVCVCVWGGGVCACVRVCVTKQNVLHMYVCLMIYLWSMSDELK